MQHGIVMTDSHHLNELRLHLKRAMKTLKTQPHKPGDRPKRAISSHVLMEAMGQGCGVGRAKKNLLKASPKQITHMQFWLDEMLKLDDDSRRIVMARAANISWRRLEEIDGRSHTTLRKVEKAGLIHIMGALDQGRAILPKDMIA